MLSKSMLEKFRGLKAMIGNTPMLEIILNYRAEQRKVYVKAEYYNYSGSIKDRIAFHIMKNAYETGLVKQGDPVAEATSGNTGIAFSAVCAYLGNPVTIFMPDWMSRKESI
ncbi:Cysteine synthase [bioreactor metagenome]|uniref:Cysteine synthase n=1 Tax=bioreactor metagenome TaxID=1076179 RepID=A0A645G5I8_9ZZZZ